MRLPEGAAFVFGDPILTGGVRWNAGNSARFAGPKQPLLETPKFLDTFRLVALTMLPPKHARPPD
jgi:hypothetical protein